MISASGTNKQLGKWITEQAKRREQENFLKTSIRPHEALSSEENSPVSYSYPSKSC